jgi:hypothetical protein
MLHLTAMPMDGTENNEVEIFSPEIVSAKYTQELQTSRHQAPPSPLTWDCVQNRRFISGAKLTSGFYELTKKGVLFIASFTVTKQALPSG